MRAAKILFRIHLILFESDVSKAKKYRLWLFKIVPDAIFAIQNKRFKNAQKDYFLIFCRLLIGKAPVAMLAGGAKKGPFSDVIRADSVF